MAKIHLAKGAGAGGRSVGRYAAIRRGQVAVFACSTGPSLPSCRPIQSAVNVPQKLPTSPTQTDPGKSV